MKHLLSFLLSLLAITLPISAQIGYQVSLLNNATGEPRANERVSVKVKITDSEGKTICEETKYETSNDFGVISMSVGDSETFANADWSKLPLFIEASVHGRLLGKSQLLSVPVAEYAKKTGTLTKEFLCSKEWKHFESGKLSFYFKFYSDNTYKKISHDDDIDSSTGTYSICGNFVSLSGNDDFGETLNYIPDQDLFIRLYGAICK